MNRLALFPGHVGKDPGAVDPASGSDRLHTIEAVVNSMICTKAMTLLRIAGIDYSLGDGNWDDRIADTADCQFGISVHCDAFSDKTKRGYHVCHYPGSGKGKTLALTIDGIMNSFNHNRCRAPHAENFKILRDTAFPCVLIECGFLTNEEDEVMLMSEEYQWDVAIAILVVSRMVQNWEEL